MPPAEALDPEEEAFRALRAAICRICQSRDITSADDARLHALVGRYQSQFPALTPELIVAELAAEAKTEDAASAVPGYAIVEKKDWADASVVTGWTGHGVTSQDGATADGDDGSDDTSSEKGPGCCPALRENSGFNPLTYAGFLSCFVVLAFLASILLTFLRYSRTPYRDWALAGGVGPTSATFRVRGPAADDGKQREFVVSPNPNLAIERDQLLNTPVAWGDFEKEEHGVKRLALESLAPMTTYYYGITRPQRAANSAVVDGDVGRFTTPVLEGRRMDFTIATGSCALTGSKARIFESALDVEPLLFLHMGDLHYEDLSTTDIDTRLAAYDRVLGSAPQRQLYMQTIFTYMWDDHDWVGNNGDSEVTGAAAAKAAYTLGIPHYELGAPGPDEAEAAKYQAFTIGTVRFVLTDLRSESVRSSAYYPGKVYSKEQKQWLFAELSRAADYDFVVWVTTRPWTDKEELGSDGWGGFVPDRNELAEHIASTIGAGPKNLLVLSGDNHMVAFDDGSNTDYSQQEDFPGGFPLLHSGPLTNYGSLLDLFQPRTHHFKEGCMAYSNELNHQFSTVNFYFPSPEERGCVRIKSYSKDADIIFEREMCGELMRRGTSEPDTCTLPKFSVPTKAVLIAAAALVVLSGVSSFCFLGLHGCYLAVSYLGIGVIYYLLTIAAAAAGALCFSTVGVNMFALAVFLLVQSFLGALFVGNAVFKHCAARQADRNTAKDGKVGSDIEVGSTSMENDKDERTKVLEASGEITFDDTSEDVTPHSFSMEKMAACADEANRDQAQKHGGCSDTEVGSTSMRRDTPEETHALTANGKTTVDDTSNDMTPHLVSAESAVSCPDECRATHETNCDAANVDGIGGDIMARSTTGTSASTGTRGELFPDNASTKISADYSTHCSTEEATKANRIARESTDNIAALPAKENASVPASEIADDLMEELDAFFENYSKQCSGDLLSAKRKGADDDSTEALLSGVNRSASSFREKVVAAMSLARNLPAAPEGLAAFLSDGAFAKSRSVQETRKKQSSLEPKRRRSFCDSPAPDDEVGIEVTNPTRRRPCFTNTSDLVEI